jgi:hypothetical protein
VLVELRSNNDYTNDHCIPYPSKVRGLGSLIILTIKIITIMRKKELDEIFDYLTEQCVNNIQKTGDTTFKPYQLVELVNKKSFEVYKEEVNPISYEIYSYYYDVREYFIVTFLLSKDCYGFEASEEIYNFNLKYDIEFIETFYEKLNLENSEDADMYNEFIIDVYVKKIKDEIYTIESNADSEEEVIEEIYKRIDLLDKEYIKKIVDDIGCDSYHILDDEWIIEEYEIEEKNTPEFKEARKAIKEYYKKLSPLIDLLAEVEGGEPNNYPSQLKEAFFEKYYNYIE